MTRGVLAGLTTLVLSACGAPTAGEEVITQPLASGVFLRMWGEGLLCADFDPSTTSCTATQRIVSRRGDRVLIEVAEAYGPAPDSELEELIAEGVETDLMQIAAYVHVDTAEYVVVEEGFGWGRDSLVAAAASATGYAVTLAGESIYPMTPSQLEEYRRMKRYYAEMEGVGLSYVQYRQGREPNTFVAEILRDAGGDVLPVVWTLLPPASKAVLRPATA